MTVKIKKHALNPEEVLYELVKAHGRSVVSGVASLTDSTGGTADTTDWIVVTASTALVNAADGGTTLAGKASSETAFANVQDAIKELFTKANEYATKLGIDTVTYNGGGAATDGTVGSISVSTTAATTGVQATETNAVLDGFNGALYVVGALSNKIANALGLSELSLTSDTFVSTVAALSVSGGTAADPGVTKAALDAELVKLRNAVATIAAKLNTFNDGLGNAVVVVA